MFPHIYTIGPLQSLLNQQVSPDLEPLGYNLWKEEPECLQWLDSKEPSSVSYVNFGSVTVMPLQHLIEFAWGLANSNHYFLWVIRPDLVIGESVILAPEFEADTKERGLIAGWCPQEEVLNHPSVGVFLTHCGWNSTIESLTAGVPMMCWPFFVDQVTNCSYTCTEWEVGMEIDNNVKRVEVKKLIREFMEGEKGKKMKNKAMEWKNLAEKATGPEGSSTLNLDKLVNVHNHNNSTEEKRLRDLEVCKAMASDKKPHAVCIPFPAQSHIKGMLKLAKLLHHRGFYITFVNTDFNQNRLIKARGPDSLYDFPNFQFKTIPDSLPPSDPNATQDAIALCGSVRTNFLTPFRNLLAQLNEDNYNATTPAVTCIVSDGVMPFTITAAYELQIPVAVFWTFSACSFMGFYQFRALLDKGLAPLKAKGTTTNTNSVKTQKQTRDESYLTNGYLDTIIDWIPGMKDIRLKDLPTCFQTTNPNDEIFNLAMESAESASQASAFGLHTFNALEQDLLDALSSMFPYVYTIGPLQLLLNQQVSPDLERLGYNLWKEEPKCLQWLDSKEPSSVIYVNFGSVTVMSLQHLVEFAWGLANSKHYFLWVIRPDLVIGDSAILPPEFKADTKETGLIAGWCPQEEVLNHPSVGVFLTHSGWNSTIESLTAGVPMMCWPFFADQVTNCRYTCTEWEVGMEIDNNVKRDEVEKLIREFMEGEKGKKMKNKAMEWKNLAEKATGPDGSSTLNLDKLVNVLLSKN
ncbi:unnamed protein product [Camellia sinensis]